MVGDGGKRFQGKRRGRKYCSIRRKSRHTRTENPQRITGVSPVPMARQSKNRDFQTPAHHARARRLIFRHIFLCPPASITYWWHYRSIDSKEYWHGSQGEQGTKAFDPQGPQADEGAHPPERAAESGGDGLWTHALWSGGAGRQTPYGSAGEDGRHNRDASGRHAPR